MHTSEFTHQHGKHSEKKEKKKTDSRNSKRRHIEKSNERNLRPMAQDHKRTSEALNVLASTASEKTMDSVLAFKSRVKDWTVGLMRSEVTLAAIRPRVAALAAMELLDTSNTARAAYCHRKHNDHD